VQHQERVCRSLAWDGEYGDSGGVGLSDRQCAEGVGDVSGDCGGGVWGDGGEEGGGGVEGDEEWVETGAGQARQGWWRLYSG